jgi:hypothetical protein
MEQTNKSSSPTLANCIGRTFIIAYKEATDLLEKTLNSEGLTCKVLRQESRLEYKDFSRMSRR